MELQADSVRAFRCPRWAELPTLSLYMDQVLIVLEESLSLFSEKAELAATSTMINNYVKLKLLTPPVNKKYAREHIAKLLMICVLKREFSISEIGGIFELIVEARGIEQAYDLFCAELESALKRAFAHMEERPHREACDEAMLALEAALGAFANKLMVQSILDAAKRHNAQQREAEKEAQKEALKESQKPQKAK